MCVSALMAAQIAGGAAAAKSLLTSTPKTSPMVDPATERAAAEARATQSANSKLAERNRSRRASSLTAVDTAGSNVPALGGKTTLGQ
jgi:hypothetical protein